MLSRVWPKKANNRRAVLLFRRMVEFARFVPDTFANFSQYQRHYRTAKPAVAFGAVAKNRAYQTRRRFGRCAFSGRTCSDAGADFVRACLKNRYDNIRKRPVLGHWQTTRLNNLYKITPRTSRYWMPRLSHLSMTSRTAPLPTEGMAMMTSSILNCSIKGTSCAREPRTRTP